MDTTTSSVAVFILSHTGCITGFETLCLPEQQHGLGWWRIEIGVVGE